jgi:hypothetical protein
MTKQRVEQRWAVFKALRQDTSSQPLPDYIERKVISIAEDRLLDGTEWRDVRYQAALVLGDVQHRKTEATIILSNLLRRTPPPPKLVLLNSLDALAQLNNRDLAKDSNGKDPATEREKARLSDPDNQRVVTEALLFILQTDDPVVSFRAIDAISKTMTDTQATNSIIDTLLRSSGPMPEGYFHALRQINHRLAAKQLSDNLLHPDQDVTRRASEALTQLGGTEALRTLQAQRAQMLDKYTTLLHEADQQIMGQFNSLMRNARFAFRVSMTMHIITFSMGVLLILTSIYLSYNNGQLPQILAPGIGGGLVTLLTLFYKDPIRYIGQAVNRLVKVNIVFLGYVRQINQIDATFKQMFISSTDFGTAQMDKTVAKIQEAVQQTLDEVKTYLIEPGSVSPEPK